MDEGVVVNCVTKKAQRISLSPEETSQRETDVLAYLTRVDDKEAAEAERNRVLAKLATVAEVEVDELKAAFGVSRASTSQTRRIT